MAAIVRIRLAGVLPVRRPLSRLAAASTLLVLGACGWSKPAAAPENAEETESPAESSSDPAKATKPAAESELGASSTPTALDNASSSSAPPPASKATIKDDSERKETPCAGANISDLASTISQAACELPANAPHAKTRPSKALLDVKMSSDAKIPPGGTARISVLYTNKGKEPLALDFTIDPDPRFIFELYAPKGSRVDKPAGNEPPLPQEVSDGPSVDPRTARVTLAPKGKATLVLPWQAVRYKWASKEKAKGALPGRGYPREPAGPLARGKYVLHLITPLTNADETSEHELSQARMNIEIAGTLQPAAPAPEASPTVASKKAPAPSEPPSEASIEQKFLKVTGATTAPPPARKKK